MLEAREYLIERVIMINHLNNDDSYLINSQRNNGIDGGESRARRNMSNLSSFQTLPVYSNYPKNNLDIKLMYKASDLNSIITG